jgi:Ca2+-binding RTX toxin-like protein
MATINGTASSETLTGGVGHDNLNANWSGGNDTMVGGRGNDNYYINSLGDRIIEAVDAGADSVYSRVNYTLADNVEQLYLDTGAVTGTGNGLNNRIDGNDLANTLSGLDGDDTLYGGLGADSMLGGDGNDTLDGGSGNDTLDGGDGDDEYYVDATGDVLRESANHGYDKVTSSVSLVLSANFEDLVLINGASNGTGNVLDNTIYGNDAANTLNGAGGSDNLSSYGGDDSLLGGTGNDTLDGGTGSDTMKGGGGNDYYVMDNLGDVIVEASNAGYDAIYSYVSYTFGANIESITLAWSAGNLYATGNDLSNYIYGNDGDNALLGQAGEDSINGSSGADTLDGGDGNDNLYGDQGNDSLVGGAGDDIMDGGSGADTMIGGDGTDIYYVNDAGDQITEAAYEGIDSVYATVDYTLAANIELMSLWGGTTGTGNALNNAIYANESANVLNGLGGNDTLYGYGGADTISGGAGNDALFGGNDNDSLLGGDGRDILNGDAGNDTMKGGNGNDTYYVDSTDDVVIESTTAGHDVVYSTVDQTLSANVEHLNLLGTAIIGIGNSIDNIIIGNNSDNNLNGLAGCDTLYGGGGNDTLNGGSGTDLLYGQDGADLFKFSANPSTGVVSIADYSIADDTIGLDAQAGENFNAGLSFTGGAGSTLSASKLFMGAGLTGDGVSDASGIYVNTSNGEIWYNSDSTTANSVLFATFQNGAASSLTAADFILV